MLASFPFRFGFFLGGSFNLPCLFDGLALSQQSLQFTPNQDVKGQGKKKSPTSKIVSAVWHRYISKGPNFKQHSQVAQKFPAELFQWSSRSPLLWKSSSKGQREKVIGSHFGCLAMGWRCCLYKYTLQLLKIDSTACWAALIPRSAGLKTLAHVVFAWVTVEENFTSSLCLLPFHLFSLG